MKKFLYYFILFVSIIGLTSCQIVIHPSYITSTTPSNSNSNVSTSELSSSISSNIVTSYISNINDSESSTNQSSLVVENGRYTSKVEVALYLHLYEKLPINFITKSEANQLGWSGGKIPTWTSTNKLSIGGDVFYNREKLLPLVSGRIYYECVINYSGGSRGAERIVFSNDIKIYYTSDHYASFTQLY